MVPRCLDQRRVAGLAGASLTVALLTCGLTSAYGATALEESAPEILHQALDCWPAEEFVVLSAEVQPPNDVQKTLAYFRWDRHSAWYFVPMVLNTQGYWVAVLPKTEPAVTGAVYFFESLDSSYTSARSEEFRVPVRPAEQCPGDPSPIIYTGSDPNITVGATRLGAPVPPGFQTPGISHFIGPTGMTSGAGGGGGVSGRTMAFIGGGAGAGALIAFGGGGSPDATTTTDGIGGVTTTASGATTTVTGGGGPAPTTTTPGGGSGGSTTTVAGGGGGGGGGSTTTVIGGGTTTTIAGGSTTTVAGGSTTTTVSGGSTTTVSGGTSTTTTAASTSSSTSSTTSSTTSITTTTTPSGTTMSVTKSDSVDPVSLGGITTYTVRVTNTGSATATDVFLTDSVPINLPIRVVKTGGCAPCGCSLSGANSIFCNFETIAPGASKSIQIDVDAPTAGSYTNTAKATATNAPDASGSEKTTVSSTLRVADKALELSFQSFLDVEPYDGRARGHVVLDERISREVVNSGALVIRSRLAPGEHLLEATATPDGGREGLWRFDFRGTPEFVPGSIRVQTGLVVSLDGTSAVFRVGTGAPPIRFTFDLRRTGAE